MAAMNSGMQFQESKLAVGIAWYLGPFAGMLVGFYLGTIWAPTRKLGFDIQPPVVEFGLMTALLGLLAGVVFAIAVTVLYPPKVASDYRELAEHDAHH
jgi:hypothetical protein